VAKKKKGEAAAKPSVEKIAADLVASLNPSELLALMTRLDNTPEAARARLLQRAK